MKTPKYPAALHRNTAGLKVTYGDKRDNQYKRP